MQLNDEYIVDVEKMLYEGKALARVNNFPIFIENACAGDKLKVKIRKVNKNFAVADIIEILSPSEHRVKPECSLHNVCGSCNWQFISYKEQVKQKKNIVYETIKNITGHEYFIEDTIPSPKISSYRCKVQTPISQTKVSKRILSGYYKKNSHELINIKHCPMQNELIDKITEFIKSKAQEFGVTGYCEKNNSGLLRHIIFRHSSDLSQILIIFVINDTKISAQLNKLAKEVIDNFENITGICANYNTTKTNVILGKITKAIYGNDYYIEKIGKYIYKVSANSFFQINPYCAELIFNKVKELISSKLVSPTILDAYSGVSSFGIWLSDIASKVVCVEEVISASNDAMENVKLNKISNIEIINGDAALQFNNMIKNGYKFDVSIIDPPRKGCSKDAIETLVQLTKKYIVYVSCGLSTLARDINVLSELGYKPIYIQPADMFPHTYHIETIVLFEKII